MLIQAVRKADLDRTLVPQPEFRPFPAWENREAWEKIDGKTRAVYLETADALRGFAWPALPASLYMDFVRNGNRDAYETLYFQRRDHLLTLALAECMTGKRTYLDDLINGLWCVCEETTWVLPAHNNPFSNHHCPDLNALADAETRPVIDLFAAETASLLAWALFLLKGPLDQESPLIARRVAAEIHRRVLAPYLAYSDFHWMGLADDTPVNNWNPWINSNVLAAALIVCDAPQTRKQVFEKCARSAQRFLDGYAPDGGCDEGPSYFSVAGASTLDLLELMHAATGGAVSLYDNELIRNLPRYSMAMHIAGDYYVNFADSAARLYPDALLLWRAGEATRDGELVDYAKGLLNAGLAEQPDRPRRAGQVYRMLQNLFRYDPEQFKGAPQTETFQCYFSGIQVMTARERRNSVDGLFLAAKGGTNGESHNHNDIGNYLIYLNGQPCICDAGVETYTKKTFSGDRYDIWTMQSGYHNTAKVNGADQSAGAAFAASDVRYQSGQNPSLSLDMARAYPPQARIKRYRRSVTLHRDTGAVTVCDEISLDACGTPTVLPLLCAVQPQVRGDTILFAAGGGTLELALPAGCFRPSVETIPLADKRLRQAWDLPCLYRLLLTRTEACTSDAFTLRYRRL